MTPEEAANKLCALLNEIEEAGHQIQAQTYRNQDFISVSQTLIAGPPCEGEPWEVRS
jgi:hypothetical protein